MDLGPPELLIIAAVVLLLFGGAKLPQLARSLGQAKKEFHEGAAEGANKSTATADPASPPTNGTATNGTSTNVTDTTATDTTPS